MQSTSVASLPSCHYPIHHCHPREDPTFSPFPKDHHHTRLKKSCSLALPTRNNCSSREQENNSIKNSKAYPHQNLTFSDQFYSPSSTDQNAEAQTGAHHPRSDNEFENFEVILTNMWWADLRAALGQRINVEGIVSSAAVFSKDRHLAIPHVLVPDIRYIDWAELHRRGFKGVVFDKDNTITAPYSLTLWAPLGPSLDRCKSVFGQDIAVFSNSAGLYEYDHDGSKATELEGTIGIKVIRHSVKKPAGSAEEIENHFGCESSKLVMVGDRPFTDIVYGNRNGFLTILTEPLSLDEEPLIVRQVRRLEVAFVNSWLKSGLKPIGHNLLPDAMQCVKDPPPL